MSCFKIQEVRVVGNSERMGGNMPKINVTTRGPFHRSVCPANDENRNDDIDCNSVSISLEYRCTRCVFRCLKCIAPRSPLFATSCKEARRAIRNPPICFCSEAQGCFV